MRLTKEQKKIIYLTIIIAFAIFLFWFFIYLPRSREFSTIKNNLKTAEENINDIIGITEGKELVDIAHDLGVELNYLKRKLPSQDEAVIKNLSQEAQKYRVEIKRIDVSKEDETIYQQGSISIRQITVSMALSGEYRDIGRYLEALKGDFPILTKVNKVDIEGSGEGKPKLNVLLEISAYLSK
ncbi:MAG: type 4a pilus biogenesis protein PilO [Candidatus Omnitrophica bacterium]|jgi:Tfp pilus assembly protein PilO|nr:type 4a pilus biogenesis protein PilO [Candidatus Omnitrophota bacterium]